ncbi:MAG TPA: M28 family peptidase [Actinomycetota bacterium]|nr:M28 family peptidase [Actinomycetota bacterium]
MFVLASAAGCAKPSVVRAPQQTPEPITPPRFSEEAARAHVEALAGRIGPRPAGSGGYRRATRYVVEEFEQLGYRARRRAFPLPQGGRSWNVAAEWPGSGPPQVLLGGHLDTVAGSPGGNDNASGVAVLLELARVVAGTPEATGLRLVAFGAEERQPNGEHTVGSTDYARSLGPGVRDGIDAMVSVDMIGKDRRFVFGWLGRGSRKAVRLLHRAGDRAGRQGRIRAVGDVSDHSPFAEAGVPAALLWTGDEPDHHRPTDTVRNVDSGTLTRSGEVLLALLQLL